MECDFLFVKMRSPPPIFRGFLSSLYLIPSTSMIVPNTSCTISRSLLLSVRFRSSSCAALKIVETKHSSTDSAFYDIANPPLLPHDGLKEIPRRLNGADWPNSNSSSNMFGGHVRSRKGRNFDTLGNGQIGNLERMKRLKRYSEMLRDCALNWSLHEGKAIHGQVSKNGIDPDLHLWVSLINFYGKCRSLNSARQVLDEMPERDVVSWTALIAGFVAEGCSSDVINSFCEMQREGIRPNEFTFATGLKACSMCLDLEFGKQIHAEVIKCRAFSDIYVGSALVDLYAKCGEIEYADKVFFFMPEHNAVSWNALLNGYAQTGDGEEVLKLFCRMKNSEMKFSEFTLSTVIKGIANSGNLKAGQVVHSMAIKIGCELDEFISCSLVDMYSKCGLADDALKVFMSIKNPDIVAWSAMISCLDQQGQKQEAAELFCLMRHTGLRPNQFTLASLVSTASDLGDLRYCESIHACVYKYGFDSENLVSNALIAMYMKIGSVHDGYRVFNAMSQWDVVSWNALLSGFHDNDTCDQGPIIFNQMLKGFKPNMYTFISILRSCSSLMNIGFGKQVHAHIIKDSLAGDGFIGTALIDMYAKCRSLEDAEVIFNRLKERDIFTWTVIIAAYAQSNQGEKAVQCFSKMQKEGVKPNEFTLASCLRGCSGIASLENGRQLHSLAIKADKALETFRIMLDEGAVPDGVTFIGILSACSHMGLIEEGKKHFNSMSEDYGITPSIEHYACMVDIFGRAGKFNEVESFIDRDEAKSRCLDLEYCSWGL
ncbi:hypothetical protein F0562_029914 [Nyssa sinensis]|uniref:Pentacotripeptide-repeat region of PRORP domain-containing protein n=1 Tax=Nyssa sinensis TaxID=561372 RepID=A0A5J5AX42_9ASTE|nr:hypothetical protein F0562_029914 [Nyssa sinensis]